MADGSRGGEGVRRAAKVDANQAEIVDDLRKLGFTVEPLHFVGRGFPDIIAGKNGKNYLFEIKNPEYDGKLTKDEQEWHDMWRGQVDVIQSTEEAINSLVDSA